MPSLQPRASPVYSPDTRVFNTPEQGSHLPNRNEGLFSGRRGFTRAEPEHAFQEQLQQHATEQLGKEWDSLFLGNETDDLRDGVDIYRKFRKDFRALACAMKQSFELVVDNRRYSGDGRGPSSVQQLQPCIAELKSVAKVSSFATEDDRPCRCYLASVCTCVFSGQVHTSSLIETRRGQVHALNL